MAKKSDGVSKSQAIRDYCDANPKAKPKQIAEALAAQGIVVTPQFVSTIRSNAKRKKTTRRPGRPAASDPAPKVSRRAARSTAASGDVSIDSLIRAKKIVEEMGSVDEAKKALDTLAKLIH